MKKFITLIVMLLSVAYGVNAQFKYYSTGKLTFGDITVPAEYTTAWEGKGHYLQIEIDNLKIDNINLGS